MRLQALGTLRAQRLVRLLPVLVALWIWLGPLGFVPVPWPDDSAFYFVADELFRWPPRWVMLPQAPFEPTYRIWNFNTMPLYPILIGIGRWVGIDGSFALKLWPLAAWAATGSLAVFALARRNLPLPLCALVALALSLDPTLRWASVLVRPESMIGLCGLAIVLGLELGIPARFARRKLWDPIAALLALAAYLHFNSIHLLFAVGLALAFHPRELWAIGWRSALYLSPWMLTVLWKFDLFKIQMDTQWTRLAVGNDWLSTPKKALQSLTQQMGSPEDVSTIYLWAAGGLWILIGLGLVWGLTVLGQDALRKIRKSPELPLPRPKLLASAGWILGACWLWNSKPEVWFTYYIHLATLLFGALVLLRAQQFKERRARLGTQTAVTALLLAMTAVFAYCDVDQALRLSSRKSWNWDVHRSFIDCVHSRLKKLEADLGNPKPFRVWDPTFPDITIELKRREPEWEFTRTNDFWDRKHLAIRHGHEVEAVVVPETINHEERTLEGPAEEFPEIRSVWMNWAGYFLIDLTRDPSWKRSRYICQRGRWQAFMYMKSRSGS